MSARTFFFCSALWALQGARSWPWVEATVYTFRWSNSSEGGGPGLHSELTYSYRINDELYAGEASWNDFHGNDVFHTGDVITIRVDPKHPNHSYFPEKQNLMLSLYVLAALFTIVLIILMFVAASRHTK